MDKTNTLMVLATRFEDLGDWTVEQQFVLQMGSSYLMAHGLGEPLKNDAKTQVNGIEAAEDVNITSGKDVVVETQVKADGGNLSQGQRQMLAIARAAVADPPALILDEATSSIDTRTERMVQDSMDKLMKNRTTFVIAHRLSTVKNADVILVVKDGKIIERGRHDELMKAKGHYYRLYTRQYEDEATSTFLGKK